jgi:hypothetical protein
MKKRYLLILTSLATLAGPDNNSEPFGNTSLPKNEASPTCMIDIPGKHDNAIVQHENISLDELSAKIRSYKPENSTDRSADNFHHMLEAHWILFNMKSNPESPLSEQMQSNINELYHTLETGNRATILSKLSREVRKIETMELSRGYWNNLQKCFSTKEVINQDDAQILAIWNNILSKINQELHEEKYIDQDGTRSRLLNETILRSMGDKHQHKVVLDQFTRFSLAKNEEKPDFSKNLIIGKDIIYFKNILNALFAIDFENSNNGFSTKDIITSKGKPSKSPIHELNEVISKIPMTPIQNNPTLEARRLFLLNQLTLLREYYDYFLTRRNIVDKTKDYLNDHSKLRSALTYGVLIPASVIFALGVVAFVFWLVLYITGYDDKIHNTISDATSVIDDAKGQIKPAQKDIAQLKSDLATIKPLIEAIHLLLTSSTSSGSTSA